MSPYTIATIVINSMIIILLMIWVSNHLDQPVNRLFVLFPVLLIMCSILLDITDSKNAEALYGNIYSAEVVRMIGLYLKLTLSYVVAVYSYALIGINEPEQIQLTPQKRLLLSVPMMVALVLAILTPQYHLVFYLDSSFAYHLGPADYIYYFIALFYLLYALFLLYHRRQYISRSTTFTTCTLIIFSTSGMLVNRWLQEVNFDLFVHSLSCLVMLYIILDSTEMVQVLTRKNEEVRAITKQTIEALTSAIEAKDAYTEGHSARVCEISMDLGRRMGFNEQQLQNLYYAAMLHDVGKIGISKTILDKPGKLTKEEYDTIKHHTIIGERITSKITLVPEIHETARWHHERWDGKGYPDGLSGNDIPLFARVVSCADAYDAMSRSRVYSPAKSPAAIRREFVDQRAKQFDPYIDDLLVSIIDQQHPELKDHANG